jgi:hypothetical protein
MIDIGIVYLDRFVPIDLPQRAILPWPRQPRPTGQDCQGTWNGRSQRLLGQVWLGARSTLYAPTWHTQQEAMEALRVARQQALGCAGGDRLSR